MSGVPSDANALVACIGERVQGFELGESRLVLRLARTVIAVALAPDHDESALLVGVGRAEWMF